MSYIFNTKPVVKITGYNAVDPDTATTTYTFDGINTADSITPDIAVTQINKFLGIGGKTIFPSGMKKTQVSEAIENE